MVTRLRSVLGLFVFAFVQASCSVDDVDFEGKLCTANAPCPGGYSCTNGACCTPRFSVQQFELDWKTSNTLRFRWTPPEAAESDFVKYVLVIGKSDAELREAQAQALAGAPAATPGTIRTADDNPELGQYELRLTGDFDVVDATVADLLEPATEYRARLIAFDTASCASVTQTVVARTDQSSSLEYVIFDDGPHPGGEPRPFDAATSFATDAALAFGDDDDVYIDWQGSDVDGTYELIGVADLNAVMENQFPSLDFSTAFVEAAVAIEGNPIAVWGEARILLGQDAGSCVGIDAFQFSPYAFRSGSDYRVIQIPLSRLVSEDGALTLERLASRPVCEFSVGQSFAAQQGVRVDAIRLRW